MVSQRSRLYTPQSFSLPTDGPKGRDVCKKRRQLFMELSSYGEVSTPSAKNLADALDCDERTIYRLLKDLKKLGCLPNATDEKGRKYTGQHGTRVRHVIPEALPLAGSSRWVPWAGTGMLFRYVRVEAGLPNSLPSQKQDCQIEKLEVAGLPNSLPSQKQDCQIDDGDERKTNPVERKTNPVERKTNPVERKTNPPENDGGEFWNSTPLGMGGPDDKDRVKIDKARAKYGDADVKQALDDWTRTKETHRLLMPWKMFANDVERYCVEIQRERQHRADMDAEHERIMQEAAVNAKHHAAEMLAIAEQQLVELQDIPCDGDEERIREVKEDIERWKSKLAELTP